MDIFYELDREYSDFGNFLTKNYTKSKVEEVRNCLLSLLKTEHLDEVQYQQSKMFVENFIKIILS